MHPILTGGTVTGIGSLPHRDARAAAEFSLQHCPELPAVPTLPRRSPFEGMIAQAVVGIRGVSIRSDGGIAVDVHLVDELAPIGTDLGHDAFGGLRAFLEVAKGRRGPVKWQFSGPITLGLALIRAGLPAATAFEVAVRAVRAHLTAIHAEVADALPDAAQVVFVDEPLLVRLMDPSFALAPEPAIDLVSGALASIDHVALVGVHCCGPADWATVLAAGPAVVSLPVSADLVDVAGLLATFLDRGGVVAWGAVPTDGPVSRSAERAWRRLASLWCALVQRGCDAARLRQQAVITPACGLALHSEGVARQVLEHVNEIGHRVRTQTLATRLTLGA